MMKAVLLVLSQPGSPTVEAEYNDWYTNTHVPEGLVVPGYTRVTRYKAFTGWDPFPQKYLSLHELDVESVDDIRRVRDNHLQHVVDGKIGRARDGVIDRSLNRGRYYIEVEPEQHSKATPAQTPNSVFITYNQPKTPDVTDEYNRWYRDVHLPDVLACPGFIRAQRFRLTDVSMIDAPWVTDLEYVNIYEHTATNVDDYNAAFAKVREGIAGGKIVMTDTLTPGAPTSVYGRISPPQTAQTTQAGLNA